MPTDTTFSKTFYITTPIYYVNGVPACRVGDDDTLLCDALARFHRLRGDKTFFLTGTDENAPKVAAAAAAKPAIETQQFADSVSQRYRDCWEFLHISQDDFIRTTEPRHAAVVAEVFLRLQEPWATFTPASMRLVLGISDETFFLDSEVENGRTKETGAAVEWVSEDNYYFKLSAYSDRLLAHIEAHPEFLAAGHAPQ